MHCNPATAMKRDWKQLHSNEATFNFEFFVICSPTNKTQNKKFFSLYFFSSWKWENRKFCDEMSPFIVSMSVDCSTVDLIFFSFFFFFKKQIHFDQYKSCERWKFALRTQSRIAIKQSNWKCNKWKQQQQNYLKKSKRSPSKSFLFDFNCTEIYIYISISVCWTRAFVTLCAHSLCLCLFLFALLRYRSLYVSIEYGCCWFWSMNRWF